MFIPYYYHKGIKVTSLKLNHYQVAGNYPWNRGAILHFTAWFPATQ